MRLETEVCIAATAEQVWTVMTDFVRYAEWKPAIPSAQGEARVGTVLARLQLAERAGQLGEAALQDASLPKP